MPKLCVLICFENEWVEKNETTKITFNKAMLKFFLNMCRCIVSKKISKKK